MAPAFAALPALLSLSLGNTLLLGLFALLAVGIAMMAWILWKTDRLAAMVVLSGAIGLGTLAIAYSLQTARLSGITQQQRYLRLETAELNRTLLATQEERDRLSTEVERLDAAIRMRAIETTTILGTIEKALPRAPEPAHAAQHAPHEKPATERLFAIVDGIEQLKNPERSAARADVSEDRVYVLPNVADR
ncbi:MAG: hypothetical protein RL291_1113 [Pseudomonadota bacterium]|jgi:hypothetical protein